MRGRRAEKKSGGLLCQLAAGDVDVAEVTPQSHTQESPVFVRDLLGRFAAPEPRRPCLLSD